MQVRAEVPFPCPFLCLFCDSPPPLSMSAPVCVAKSRMRSTRSTSFRTARSDGSSASELPAELTSGSRPLHVLTTACGVRIALASRRRRQPEPGSGGVELDGYALNLWRRGGVPLPV
eukprot:360113-Chlamydomonas_euryale.AAC.3